MVIPPGDNARTATIPATQSRAAITGCPQMTFGQLNMLRGSCRPFILFKALDYQPQTRTCIVGQVGVLADSQSKFTKELICLLA
jgi:hypothetical protein